MRWLTVERNNPARAESIANRLCLAACRID